MRGGGTECSETVKRFRLRAACVRDLSPVVVFLQATAPSVVIRLDLVQEGKEKLQFSKMQPGAL